MQPPAPLPCRFAAPRPAAWSDLAAARPRAEGQRASRARLLMRARRRQALRQQCELRGEEGEGPLQVRRPMRSSRARFSRMQGGVARLSARRARGRARQAGRGTPRILGAHQPSPNCCARCAASASSPRRRAPRASTRRAARARGARLASGTPTGRPRGLAERRCLRHRRCPAPRRRRAGAPDAPRMRPEAGAARPGPRARRAAGL
jgi:hypothetical protein